MEFDGQVIRAFVDGELPAAEAARLEQAAASDAELAARIAFERRLRERIAHVLTCDVSHRAQPVKAPAELAESIRARLRMACSDQTEVGANSESAVGEPTRENHFIVRGDVLKKFEGPPAQDAIPLRAAHRAEPRIRINPFAVAACIAIVAGAILVGIFGTPLHQLRGTGDPAAPVAQEIGDHAIAEHNRCREMLKLKGVDVDALSMTPLEIAQLLGTTTGYKAPIVDFTNLGYTLVGAQRCELQRTQRGTNDAVQMVYRSDETGMFLSVFVERVDDALMADAAGRVYSPSPNCCVMSDGAVVYAVVACDPAVRSLAVEQMLEQLGLR